MARVGQACAPGCRWGSSPLRSTRRGPRVAGARRCGVSDGTLHERRTSGFGSPLVATGMPEARSSCGHHALLRRPRRSSRDRGLTARVDTDGWSDARCCSGRLCRRRRADRAAAVRRHRSPNRHLVCYLVARGRSAPSRLCRSWRRRNRGPSHRRPAVRGKCRPGESGCGSMATCRLVLLIGRRARPADQR